MWDRFPPRMRKAMTTALELAGRAGADEADVEHLLAAMVQDPSTAASFMLGEAGIPPATVLARVAIDGDAPPRPERATKFSSAAMHVLDVAVAEADRRGERHVATEHVA